MIAGPLLSIILDRDVSCIVIPGTFSIWSISLVFGIQSRRTEEGRRAAKWPAYVIAIGLATLLSMEVRKRMDERKNANAKMHTIVCRASASPEV
jgi:hypothetical protein